MTLAIAEAAVALTVIATLYQLVVSPGEQRRLRHTVRVEEGAAKIMPLLGLRAGLALGHVQDAWKAGDAASLGTAAGELADLAGKAYPIAESLYDPLEVLIGVLMVEAGELRDAAPRLASVPLKGWPSDPAVTHLINSRAMSMRCPGIWMGFCVRKAKGSVVSQSDWFSSDRPAGFVVGRRRRRHRSPWPRRRRRVGQRRDHPAPS